MDTVNNKVHSVNNNSSSYIDGIADRFNALDYMTQRTIMKEFPTIFPAPKQDYNADSGEIDKLYRDFSLNRAYEVFMFALVIITGIGKIADLLGY